MIVRSFVDGFSVCDWTEEVSNVPNQWGLLNSLGLFQEESVSQHVVVFEETTKDGALIVDRVRGDRATVGKDATRKLHTFAVGHFPYSDSISPQDIQGKRAYGSANVETLEAVRVRKMERIRQNHAWTLEFARAQAITAGTVYSPSGTNNLDWNAEFGVTRTSVDFLLGTAGTEVLAKIETGLVQVLDNTGGSVVTGTVVLTSPEFFAKLISHASIRTAYQYYSSTQEPLRQRLGGDMALRREFNHGGARFIECRDSYAGQRLIPAGKAYMVPTGTDAFRTYFSPANKFTLANTEGMPLYLFESASPKGESIELDSESNFINAVLRPQLIVEFTSSN